jgi:hypothetical protein
VGQLASDRFWPKVDKRGPDGCWPWKASKHNFGYGKFYVGVRADGRALIVDAHRYSWELAHKRAVPRGKLVTHSCDNPACVNPGHLAIGDHKSNTRDVSVRGRWNRKLTIPDVHEIRRRRALGDTTVAIAADFGVTHALVSHICNGRKWRHV